MLLQIAEPQEAAEPARRGATAIGIDFGTTHSLVAATMEGQVRCLTDAQGQSLLPSLVAYDSSGAVRVGDDAANDAHCIASIKRILGRSAAELTPQQRALYGIADTEAAVPRLATPSGEKAAIEIAAEILRRLKERAEQALGEVRQAVITVPAYFDDAKRQAVKDAAQLAGLEVLRLLNEPTAAALAYGLDHGARGRYAVFDLGGGTFDFSLLRLQQGVFEVVGTGGDSALGGDDYDLALAQHCAAAWGWNPAELSAADWRALLRSARAAKEALSEKPEARIAVTRNGRTHSETFSRAQFEALTADLTARSIAACRAVLQDAQWQNGDLDGVVLAGGATRMPAMRAAVRDFFGREPLTDLNPEEIVALGAGAQARALSGGSREDVLLLDICALSLGLEMMGGVVEKLIPRNSPIPAARAQDFTTFRDGQTALALHVVQGEREIASECRSLARFELRGIPPMKAGAARIRVSFAIDADGLLRVQARELTSGREAGIEVKPSYGLAPEEIAAMLQNARSAAQTDMRERSWREAKIEAERLLEHTQAALREDGDWLSAPEREAIEQAVSALRQLCQLAGNTPVPATLAEQTRALNAAAQTLAKSSEAFAQQRMDRAMAQALKGRAVSEV